MRHHDKHVWLLAALLSALAGYVDALGFLQLGGFFVSFMSGNSTRFAVDLGRGGHLWLLALGLIGAFVVGVMLGSLSGRLAGAWRGPAVLTLVTALLGAAATLHMLQASGAAVLFMTLAMGAENTIFERDGEVSISLTYMTGTLVKLGQHLTSALGGGERWGWLPYLLLWLGLVCGAVAGALAYPVLGLNGLWIATAWAATVTVLVALR